MSVKSSTTIEHSTLRCNYFRVECGIFLHSTFHSDSIFADCTLPFAQAPPPHAQAPRECGGLSHVTKGVLTQGRGGVPRVAARAPDRPGGGVGGGDPHGPRHPPRLLPELFQGPRPGRDARHHVLVLHSYLSFVSGSEEGVFLTRTPFDSFPTDQDGHTSHATPPLASLSFHVRCEGLFPALSNVGTEDELAGPMVSFGRWKVQERGGLISPSPPLKRIPDCPPPPLSS